jgi:Predicted esterase of the alpha-beta hydrolase superfamily
MKKTAFVLNGCGALGAYQANALNYLDSRGIKPDLLVGVSSGAINCFGYSAVSSTRLYNFWSRLNHISDCFQFSYYNTIFGTGAYTTSPLIKKVKEETKDILHLSTDIIFPYVDIMTGEVILNKYVAGTNPKKCNFRSKESYRYPRSCLS